jgi:hypothetical protein
MKKPLQFASGIVLLLFQVFTSNGQTIILAENFSGFTTGTHTLPSTSDVSSSLDTRTSVPGWRGNLIYSAGGEIKIGTSSSTGWIETPPLDLSAADMSYRICFDIARWPSDPSTVQVYLDGNPLGDVITPSDSYERNEILISTGTSSSRIRIQSLTKRFFIDNLTLSADNIPTLDYIPHEEQNGIKMWPVPVTDELNISGSAAFEEIMICDITGRIMKKISVNGEDQLKISVSNFSPGVYIVSFISGKTRKLAEVIKQ